MEVEQRNAYAQLGLKPPTGEGETLPLIEE
jgi:hypothetical protein